MKNENHKQNNKGFSLVELIVVIAIMVVLVAVLSVVILGYVDKAKIAKDVQAADDLGREVRRCILLDDKDLRKKIVEETLPTNITWNSSNAKISDEVTSEELLYYLNKHLGGQLPISSFNEDCLWALEVKFKDASTSEENLIVHIYLGPTSNVNDMKKDAGYDEQYMLYPEVGSYWNK